MLWDFQYPNEVCCDLFLLLLHSAVQEILYNILLVTYIHFLLSCQLRILTWLHLIFQMCSSLQCLAYAYTYSLWHRGILRHKESNIVQLFMIFFVSAFIFRILWAELSRGKSILYILYPVNFVP